MKKKILYSLLGIIVFLILTNPSISAFREYMGITTYADYKIRRTNNLFVYSIYQYEQERYFAILLNFYPIKNPFGINDSSKWQPPSTDTMIDTTVEEITLPPPPIRVNE